MIKKSKLLICMLFMSMVLTVLPGMRSYAEEAEGEAVTEDSGLQDENSQRLDEVTAMDEDGSIYAIGESDGTVEADVESAEEGSESDSGIAMFSARSISPMVVNFNTKGNAVTNYSDEVQGISGYTNGAYGADAAYLGTTSDGKIRFMLAGVTGAVDASEVELLSFDSVMDNVSYYTVSGGSLVHYISQNLNSAPVSALNNGPAPSYLTEGTKYYSYDGHYFYTDYAVMSADYQNGSNGASAVNAGNPFYNYFQFLDMRSSTGYTADTLNSILASAMTNAGIDPSSSKLTGTGQAFVENQNTYNVNALLSLSLAVNESGWGTSWICTEKNNIFGLNAVDTSPGLSADSFASIEDCIREFMADWMADGYLSSSDWRNHGEYLGNKGGGINVSYASDPYWGEKAAAIAWNLDAAGGNLDYQGIVEDSGSSSDTPDTGTEVPDTTPETPDTTPDTGTDTPDTTPETPDTTPDTGTETSDTTPDTGTDTPDTTPETPDTTPDTGTETPDAAPETPDESVTTPDENTGDTVTTPDENTGDTVTTPDENTGDTVTTPDENTGDTETTPAENEGEPAATTQNTNTAATTTTNTDKTQETEAAPTAASVQNTAQNTDTNTAAPQTGDSGNVAVWTMLLMFSAGAAVTAVLYRRRSF
ncbi:MAG TPA: glucosaminidase domain-containing protein [Candidatus Mediterraneibacter vanvlietii]|nr:glucosaminidase domain-containing protein [Candidatus Mediterraneibacter vanvlietii]